MKPRVLYVDDDVANLKALSYGLDDVFEMHTVESGQLALQALRTDLFDAVVVDQRMPGMSGVELCTQIRKMRGPVTLLYTAYADANTTRSAVNAGRVSAVLAKPLPNETLRDEIYRSIRHAREARTIEALRAATFWKLEERGILAARAKAAQGPPPSVTDQLFDLLYNGDAEHDPTLEPVREADRELHAFFSHVGGMGSIDRVDLSSITLLALEVLRAYLPPTLSVRLTSEKLSPIVFGDWPTFTHALLVLLQGATGDVQAQVVTEGAEGSLRLDVQPSPELIRLADALMATYGGSVERKKHGVELCFAKWGSDPDQRPQPIASRRLDRSLRGYRIDSEEIDVLLVGCALEAVSVKTATATGIEAAKHAIETRGPAVVLAAKKYAELSSWVTETYPHIKTVLETSDAQMPHRAHALVPPGEVNLAGLAEWIRDARDRQSERSGQLLAATSETSRFFFSETASLAKELQAVIDDMLDASEKAGIGKQTRLALSELDSLIGSLPRH